MQVAKKISKLILPDDLSVNIQHKTWHGKQPTTLTAVTLYIATHLGSRVMSPGVPIRTIAEVWHPFRHSSAQSGSSVFLQDILGHTQLCNHFMHGVIWVCR